MISPTDAVAATALGKKLGLPPRLVTILEGESLVNDATALVLLRSAIAATAATVSFWAVVGDFAYAVLLAIAIGLVVGFVTVLVRSKLRDSMLDTAISFAVPFIAYLPAEYFHASGVLAVVVAGLYSGHSSAKRFSAQARISERLNWRTVQFVLENGVFLLMGLQVSLLVTEVRGGRAQRVECRAARSAHDGGRARDPVRVHRAAAAAAAARGGSRGDAELAVAHEVRAGAIEVRRCRPGRSGG